VLVMMGCHRVSSVLGVYGRAGAGLGEVGVGLAVV
jgi:hypothetical protein